MQTSQIIRSKTVGDGKTEVPYQLGNLNVNGTIDELTFIE